MSQSIAAGTAAPAFDLAADNGARLSLTNFKGSKLVLYFYPKDDTSGCTAEAIAFNALKPRFEASGTHIVGISADSVASHQKFKKKYQLDLDLASDEEKSMLSLYGVWVEKSMYGKKYMGIERTTILIDKEGKIARIWQKVKVPGHAEEVLKAAEKI